MEVDLKGGQNYHTVTWGPVNEPPKQRKGRPVR